MGRCCLTGISKSPLSCGAKTEQAMQHARERKGIGGLEHGELGASLTGWIKRGTNERVDGDEGGEMSKVINR